jgi:hypothetical protein
VIITVVPVNDPPVIADTATLTDEDTPVTICVPFTDTDGTAPFSVSADNCALNGTATAAVVGNTVCVTYTPDPDFAGTDSACFVLCDNGGGCTGFTVTITVIPVNDPPVIGDTSVVMNQDDSVTVCIPFADADGLAPYNVTAGCAVNGSANAWISGNTVCVTYIPDPGFSGTDSICLIICDAGGLCDTSYVNVLVNPVVPHSELGLAKNVTMVYKPDGSVDLLFVIGVENIGNDTLSNIQITDDLSSAFPLPAVFTLTTIPVTSGSLAANPLFNGLSDIRLLNEALS